MRIKGVETGYLLKTMLNNCRCSGDADYWPLQLSPHKNIFIKNCVFKNSGVMCLMKNH